MDLVVRIRVSLCRSRTYTSLHRDFFRFAQKIPGGGTVPKTTENQAAFGVVYLFMPSCSLKQASFAYGHKKTSVKRWFSVVLAEREGFEPPVPLGTLVFKTSAFDHSAISPIGSVATS